MEYWKNVSLKNIEGEIWKDIEGYENLYQISNKGRLKALPRKKFNNYHNFWFITKEIIRKLRFDKVNGYILTTITNNKGKLYSYKVHRLVAQAFIPNPENKPEVNHIDGNKTNNNDWNLEWSTKIENTRHTFKNKHPSSRVKLDFIKVEEIKQLSKNGMKSSKIASLYNVDYRHIWKILTGKAWNF